MGDYRIRHVRGGGAVSKKWLKKSKVMVDARIIRVYESSYFMDFNDSCY
ncbi:hypothetical protein B194_1555 [Serratia plymuthica A30]|nr:hypothetical protein B194_1555 [Serratia plymuthica A30]